MKMMWKMMKVMCMMGMKMKMMCTRRVKALNV